MAAIALTTAYNGRPRVGLPSTRLVNMIAELTPGGPGQAMRTTRPGIDNAFTNGTGPILRMNQIPGVFNGDVFSISGNELYRQNSLVGNVAYGNNPRMAAANGQLAIVSGGALYVYQGNTLTQVEFFDDGTSRLPSFSSVAVLYNIFVFAVAGSTQGFFSKVGDATSINAGNFFNAQTSPDPIVEVQVLAEELYFFKPTSIEIWDFTGNLTAPFAESQGRTFARGCASQGSVVTRVDNSLIWVSDNFGVYRSSNVPLKISTEYVDDRLRQCGQNGIAQTVAFYLSIEGHEFYILDMPTINETLVYDAASKEWAEWGSVSLSSTNPGMFICGTSAGQASTGIYLGSYTDGKIYTLNPETYNDAGQAIKCIASGFINIDGGVKRCNNVSIQCVRGGGTPEFNPSVNMRFSDDGGRTWSPWLPGHLGFSGQYDYKATWRYLGLMSSPGRYFEWEVSDSVPFTFSQATYNEARV